MLEVEHPVKVISLVVPCYNEEEVLSLFLQNITELTKTIDGYEFEFVFVDDGSTDKTLEILMTFAKKDNRVRIVELSRNFGKEAAMTAGIDFCKGDAVIPLDADLQDPPELIIKMVDHWNDGAQVVLARRVDRSSDGFLKRQSARSFYRFHNAITDVKIPENVGDFRLMDRVVVDAIHQMPERNRFLKGIFAWVGFRTVIIDYVRAPRAAGDTKFSGFRLWNFALEGITSFSAVPLKVWTYVGLLAALLGMSYGVFILFYSVIFGNEVPGYTSTILVVLFFGSLNMVSIGIMGEYISRIYTEVKERPLYLVNQFHREDQSDGA